MKCLRVKFGLVPAQYVDAMMITAGVWCVNPSMLIDALTDNGKMEPGFYERDGSLEDFLVGKAGREAADLIKQGVKGERMFG